MDKFAKIIGYIEALLAAVLGVLCILSVREVFFPPLGQHFESAAWAALGLTLFAPLAVGLLVAGIALVRNFRGKWYYQSLPGLAVIGVGIFLWWADSSGAA